MTEIVEHIKTVKCPTCPGTATIEPMGPSKNQTGLVKLVCKHCGSDIRRTAPVQAYFLGMPEISNNQTAQPKPTAEKPKSAAGETPPDTDTDGYGYYFRKLGRAITGGDDE